MPANLVIDTNVLAHANNKAMDRCEDSVQLIKYLLGSNVLIYLDEGFDLSESRNKSIIGLEYLTHLRFGMLGYALVVQLAGSRRIEEISKKVHAHTAKAINQCLRNVHDRTFVRVTINSNNKIFVSHDFTDFSEKKRKDLRDMFGIKILVAADIK